MVRHSILRDALCLVLVVSLAFSGCTSFRTQYHGSDGALADLKVACYWRDASGQRHFVSGLKVEVVPMGFQSDRRPTAVTDHTQPLVFNDLLPGTYRLIISEGNKDHISQTIRLKPGRELSVRMKVHGRIAQKVAVATAQGLAAAFVVAAGAAIVLAIVYLESERDDDDDRRHFHD
jgi:hypothetical protein